MKIPIRANMPATFIVGTTSWTDASVIQSGGLYPKGVTSAEARLRYYASVFGTVEVDSSYYALPAPRNSELWVDRTPETFVFTIKAFRLFTQHQTPPEAIPKDLRVLLEPITKRNLYAKDLPDELLDELWRRYLMGVEPLQRAGKLKGVLFQFAPWVAYSTANLDYMARCQTRLKGIPMQVEFRHQSWFSEAHAASTMTFARQQGIGVVVVDEPQGFANSVPPLWEVTSADFCVVRLHGRNRETWNLKGLASSADRFKYLYDSTELADLHAHIRELGHQAAQVQVLFNNNYADWGVRNALAMKDLLAAPQPAPE